MGKRGPRLRSVPLPQEPATLVEAVTRLSETMASGRQWMTAKEAAEFLRYPKPPSTPSRRAERYYATREGPAGATTLRS